MSRIYVDVTPCASPDPDIATQGTTLEPGRMIWGGATANGVSYMLEFCDADGVRVEDAGEAEIDVLFLDHSSTPGSVVIAHEEPRRTVPALRWTHMVNAAGGAYEIRVVSISPAAPESATHYRVYVRHQ